MATSESEFQAEYQNVTFTVRFRPLTAWPEAPTRNRATLPGEQTSPPVSPL